MKDKKKEFNEQLWARVEEIAFNAIRDISVEIAELPDTEQAEIFHRFDEIANEILRRTNEPSSSMLH